MYSISKMTLNYPRPTQPLETASVRMEIWLLAKVNLNSNCTPTRKWLFLWGVDNTHETLFQISCLRGWAYRSRLWRNDKNGVLLPSASAVWMIPTLDNRNMSDYSITIMIIGRIPSLLVQSKRLITTS